MGKVITSSGLQDFIQNGAITHVPDHKPGTGSLPPPEAKPPEALVEAGKPTEKEAEIKIPEPVEEGLDADDKDLSEAIRKKIGKKHRAMKEAQEAAQDAETFAKGQYERARLAEERAADLERRLGEVAPKVEAPKLVEPDLKDFTKDGQVDWIAYTKATREYDRKVSVEDYKAEQAKTQAAAETARRAEVLRASADESRKRHSDFDEVMAKLEGDKADMVPQFVLSYIEECSDPGEMSYALATNAEVRERIAKLSPIRGIAELGKLEEKLTKPVDANKAPVDVKPPERGGAPPPITPLNTSGSGSVNIDPAKMSYKELRAYERERERNKKR